MKPCCSHGVPPVIFMEQQAKGQYGMTKRTITTFFSWRSSFQKSNLASTTKLVLFCISTYMNDHGNGCFPSIQTLMVDTSLSNRAVITHIKKASEAGFLSVSQHGYSGQKWKRNEYSICIPENKNVVNVTTERGEPNDINVVNEVHSNTPLNTPYNKKIIIEKFEEWWKLYPRKTGKGKAREKYGKAVKDGLVTESKLMEALKNRLPEWKNTDEQYIPHPATWLHGERWDDEIKFVKPSYLM